MLPAPVLSGPGTAVALAASRYPVPVLGAGPGLTVLRGGRSRSGTRRWPGTARGAGTGLRFLAVPPAAQHTGRLLVPGAGVDESRLAAGRPGGPAARAARPGVYGAAVPRGRGRRIRIVAVRVASVPATPAARRSPGQRPSRRFLPPSRRLRPLTQ
jgi:hypothetical protein